MNKKIIFLDFDGTVVYHRYPEIGDLIPESINVIKELISNGHTVILNSYRSNSLQTDSALNFLKEFGIEIESTKYKIIPIKFDLDNILIFIDDITSNIPLLIDDKNLNYVDWATLKKLFKNKKILK